MVQDRCAVEAAHTDAGRNVTFTACRAGEGDLQAAQKKNANQLYLPLPLHMKTPD